MSSFSPDDSDKVTADFLKRNPQFYKPHVIILGAGASIQAFPKGDKEGIELPSMRDLVAKIGIRDSLSKMGKDGSGDDFEAVYSRLYSHQGNAEYLADIEEQVRAYFSRMQLPEHPTLYDHLLLSLRRDDLVATFNWDPLLFDSWCRLRDRFDSSRLPSIAYLHGNVRVGYCPSHQKYGHCGLHCDECGAPLKPTPLLFPIKEKDYETDDFISDAWRRLQFGLKHALAVTIFGYSAPSSDRAAISVMKTAWNDDLERQFETLFFVDVKPDGEIRNTWKPFIFSHHFRIHSDFYESWLPLHARRSVEALAVPTIEGKFVEDIPIPRNASWEGLVDWFDELIEYEDNLS
jgi:hypothetical protein